MSTSDAMFFLLYGFTPCPRALCACPRMASPPRAACFFRVDHAAGFLTGFFAGFFAGFLSGTLVLAICTSGTPADLRSRSVFPGHCEAAIVPWSSACGAPPQRAPSGRVYRRCLPAVDSVKVGGQERDVENEEIFHQLALSFAVRAARSASAKRCSGTLLPLAMSNIDTVEPDGRSHDIRDEPGAWPERNADGSRVSLSGSSRPRSALKRPGSAARPGSAGGVKFGFVEFDDERDA